MLRTKPNFLHLSNAGGTDILFPFMIVLHLFNQCATEAIAACEIQLAAELAAWKAKMTAWKSAGSVEELKPTGKKGNIVTRMYERTGWWPLQRDSESWNKASAPCVTRTNTEWVASFNQWRRCRTKASAFARQPSRASKTTSLTRLTPPRKHARRNST